MRRLTSLRLMARIDTSNPAPKKSPEVVVANVTFFSTKRPPNAADIPRKKIAKEKANSMDETGHSIREAMSALSRLQQ